MPKDPSRLKKRSQKKKAKLRRIFAFFLLTFIIALSFGGYLVYKTIAAANTTYSELERGEKSDLRTKEVDINKDPFSMLIIGVENYVSGGQNGRSDVLMVATINPEDKSIKLVSIPRDTRVEISDKEYTDKINHAYNDGKEATINTVENFLDIPIDYYTTVNFDGFKNTIDVLGGIKVNVPFNFWEKSDTTNERIYFTEGDMTLNGEEALAFARMRKRDPMGDFGRNERQKEVVKAVIQKVVSPTTLLKVDELAKEIGNNIETNFRISDGIKLVSLYSGFNTSAIETFKIEGYDDTINNIYYFIPDETSVQSVHEQLYRHLNPSLYGGESSLETEGQQLSTSTN